MLMRPKRTATHSVYDLKVHLVWITKYRYKVLTREVGERIRELIRQTCDALDIEIIQGLVSKDHVHLYVSYPPKLSVSDMVKRFKGRTSRKIQQEFPHLSKRYWGKHFLGHRVCGFQFRTCDGRHHQRIHQAAQKASESQR